MGLQSSCMYLSVASSPDECVRQRDMSYNMTEVAIIGLLFTYCLRTVIHPLYN